MTLPAAPPIYASWAALVAPIKQGETGWRPWALQRALNAVNARESALFGPLLVEDGSFGPKTADAVVAFQTWSGLTADGIAGAATQKALVQWGSHRVAQLVPGLPDGLMAGFAEGEGVNLLAPTNAQTPGGVDCGSMQLRVLGPPYDMGALQQAFSLIDAMTEAASRVLAYAPLLRQGAWCQAANTDERTLRCAALHHNWPAGAEYYAKHGYAPLPGVKLTWGIGTTFPDGTDVLTRQDWCEYYAMGGAHGPGSVTKYVQRWS